MKRGTLMPTNGLVPAPYTHQNKQDPVARRLQLGPKAYESARSPAPYTHPKRDETK